VIVFRIGGNISAGRASALFTSPRTIEIYQVKIVVGTSPSAATLDVTLGDLGQPGVNTNRFSAAYTSILSGGNHATIAGGAGIFSVTKTGAVFDGGLSLYTLLANNELGVDVITAGTGTADLFIYVYGRKL
jgi:hypothetical protein